MCNLLFKLHAKINSNGSSSLRIIELLKSTSRYVCLIMTNVRAALTRPFITEHSEPALYNYTNYYVSFWELLFSRNNLYLVYCSH